MSSESLGWLVVFGEWLEGSRCINIVASCACVAIAVAAAHRVDCQPTSLPVDEKLAKLSEKRRGEERNQ